MSLSKKALIIFARKPELGKVKTRLAAGVGDEIALQIYIRLLTHTRAVAKELNCDSYVFLTEPTDDNFWDGFYCEIQEGTSLGDKMQHAFKKIFLKGYHQCVIIGSDCPGLKKEIVEHAFDYLLKDDVVIGSAADGGYYLLGMKKMINSVFENKEWSTENVFRETIEAIEKDHLTYTKLVVLNDVDEVADVPKEWLNDFDIK